MSAVFTQILFTGLALSAGWSSTAYQGSRSGYVAQTGGAGQTVSMNAQATDFFLIYPPANGDAYMQVSVDGANTKVINLRGQKNTNPQGVAQEKITVKPLATGLSNAPHTITLTTMSAANYQIDSIEFKTGTTATTDSSVLGSGDSITQKGGQALDINGYVDTGGVLPGWFTQLATYLGRTPVDIGEGSATTDQILIQAYDYMRQASSIPSIITLMAGMNDCLSYAAMNQSWVSDRFNDAVDIIKSICPSAFLVMSKVTATEGGFASAMTQINAWNGTIAAVAASRGVPIAETASYPGSGYTFDGVHPTYAGHTAIANNFESLDYSPGNTTTTTAAPGSTTTTLAPATTTTTTTTTTTAAPTTTTTTTAPPLVAPVIQTYDLGSGFVTPHWTSVIGAVSYNLFWTDDGSTPTSGSNKIAGISDTSYRFVAAPGTATYRISVQAVNGAGAVSALSTVLTVNITGTTTTTTTTTTAAPTTTTTAAPTTTTMAAPTTTTMGPTTTSAPTTSTVAPSTTTTQAPTTSTTTTTTTTAAPKPLVLALQTSSGPLQFPAATGGALQIRTSAGIIDIALSDTGAVAIMTSKGVKYLQ